MTSKLGRNNEYYKQFVDLERIENIKLASEIPTIQDFQPEGMSVHWEGTNPQWRKEIREVLDVTHFPTSSHAHIVLYSNKEDAAKDYNFNRGDTKYARTQFKKMISPYDAYRIYKVERLWDEHFGHKSNKYSSEIDFVKNNVTVSINCTNYNDNTGSSKQIMIDTVADYLRKFAAKEKTLDSQG